MKNRTKRNPFLRIVVLASFLFLTAIAAAIGLFYYVFAIPEPEGLSLASWPYTFTENFSAWMENEDGKVNVKEIGLDRLDKYGLWLQVIDENGQEVFSYHKPDHYPSRYSASELMAFHTGAYENGYTVFASSFESGGKTWGYRVGFPYAVGKYMLYYNGENVSRLFPVFQIGLRFALCFLALFVLVFGVWLARNLGRITKGIGAVSLRSYQPLPEKGVFREIYGALNKMDREIRHSDKVQRDTERTRREWITNITHDLKTPLSPVKGYAELLADCPVPENETVQEYGKIILKNANHAEKLINDLKLTYQLDSGVIPYNPKPVQLIRCLRELIIDLVNDPVLEGRTIEFESGTQEMVVPLDQSLFRRAMGNLIVNALTHNPPETKVTVRVDSDSRKGAAIFICDNGIGMGEAELAELFDRYYRGTNTKEKPEGSGLGLAIAKQIVTLHGGKITVKSKEKEGTQFTVFLPLESK